MAIASVATPHAGQVAKRSRRRRRISRLYVVFLRPQKSLSDGDGRLYRELWTKVGDGMRG
jgi:hypothetical protein